VTFSDMKVVVVPGLPGWMMVARTPDGGVQISGPGWDPRYLSPERVAEIRRDAYASVGLKP